jgi:hypothetical protein
MKSIKKILFGTKINEMGNVCCLLDACTVINLIHIDDDDFLLKKIRLFDLHINDSVFTEIKLNVYDRLTNNISKYSDEEKKKLIRKEIDQKLSFFRGRKNNNDELLKDLGNGFFEKVREMTGYTKRPNGELCSTAYALYLSRLNQKKVFFYTDDFPAKKFFSHFFAFQQIGQIKDTVDFLILVYWIDEDFNEIQLDRVLSDLYSQYAIEVTLLIERLDTFYNEKVNGEFIKSKKDIVFNLRSLMNNLKKLNFHGINFYWQYFESNKTKCKEVFEIIKEFYSVFEIETNPNSETLLTKIKHTRNLIKEQKIYKWNDLLTS